MATNSQSAMQTDSRPSDTRRAAGSRAVMDDRPSLEHDPEK
jgi:hypothetical protein